MGERSRFLKEKMKKVEGWIGLDAIEDSEKEVSLLREEAISILVDDLETWDPKVLREYAKTIMRERLEQYCNKHLLSEYNNRMAYEIKSVI